MGSGDVCSHNGHSVDIFSFLGLYSPSLLEVAVLENPRRSAVWEIFRSARLARNNHASFKSRKSSEEKEREL